jgi:hypothetical protein
MNVLDMFGSELPYDPLDLALEIGAMGPLTNAMPSISQSLGENEDLFVVQKMKREEKERSTSASLSPKDKPSSPTSEGKKRGHRRSISDPVNLRHQIFEAPFLPGGDVDMGVSPSEDLTMDTMESYAYISPSSPNYHMSSSKTGYASSVSSESKGADKKSRSDSFSSRSKNYACSRCGKPKKGHVCPLAPSLPPKMVNMSTQVDLNTTSCERVLVTRQFRSSTD